MSDPLIFVLGNCQSHVLAAALAANGAGTVCILHRVYGFRPSYRGIQPFVLPMEEAQSTADRFARYGRRVILIEQITPLAKPTPLDFLPGVPRVHFPHLQLQGWWPKGVEPPSVDRLKRQWAFDLAAIRRSEAAAGLDQRLSGHIEAVSTQRPIFSMSVHPDGGLMTMLYRIIADRLHEIHGLNLEQDGEELPNLLDFYSDHPLSSAVVRDLGLSWAEVPWYQTWTAAIEAHRRGDPLASIRLYEGLVQGTRHDAHIWGGYAAALLDAGHRQEANRAYGVAHRAFPHNAHYAQSWIQTLSPSHVSPEQEPLLKMVSQLYEPPPSGLA
jgi:hypothetical protein